MKTILILGAGGFIGKNLCHHLAKNHHVIAYDLNMVPELMDQENIQLIQGNFVLEDNFTALVDNVDIIYHLISTTIPAEDTSHIVREIEQNVIPTVRLLEAVKESNVQNIIFASSGGTVYGEKGTHCNEIEDRLKPICSYGVQKKTIESYFELYGHIYNIPYRIARISNPYGLGQDPSKPQGIIPIFINRILSGQPIKVFGKGENKRDYIFVQDLLEALEQLGDYDGEQHIFNIGHGDSHSIKEIIQLIEQESGKSFVNIEYVDERKCDVSNSILDIERTKEELNWSAEKSLEDGIQFILDYYKQVCK